MTQRETFKKFMQKKGFTVSNYDGQPFQGYLDITPYHRKTNVGHHNIISSIHFVMWGGSNVKKGDLGCVTFYYSGREKRKFSKTVEKAEILKLAFCPKNVKEAMKEFDKWNQASHNVVSSWKVIL